MSHFGVVPKFKAEKYLSGCVCLGGMLSILFVKLKKCPQGASGGRTSVAPLVARLSDQLIMCGGP